MRDLLGVIERRKPDGVAILGDLTEEKDRHSAQLVNQVVSELGAIASLASLLILPGNHDYLNEGHPFFAFLSHIPNIEWVSGVKAASELSTSKFRSIFEGCLFLPHTRNYEKDWAHLDLHNRRFIFAHNTFNGAEVGWGRKLEGIPIDIFPKGSKVLAGDIHVPQKLGPVEYIGCPYLRNFGDAFEPRMISISGKSYSSIRLGAWPQKRLIEIDDIAQLKYANCKDGDIVKVRCAVDDMGTWHATHKAIGEWAEKKEVWLYRAEPVLLHKVVNRRIRLTASEALSDAAFLKQYAKRNTLADEILKAGLGLLK
jgi:hypothetical protein